MKNKVKSIREFWIAAIDEESGNYLPKKLPRSLLKQAKNEGIYIHESEVEAQVECDHQNSL